LQEKVRMGRCGSTACRLSPPVLPRLMGVLAREAVEVRLPAECSIAVSRADAVLQAMPRHVRPSESLALGKMMGTWFVGTKIDPQWRVTSSPFYYYRPESHSERPSPFHGCFGFEGGRDGFPAPRPAPGERPTHVPQPAQGWLVLQAREITLGALPIDSNLQLQSQVPAHARREQLHGLFHDTQLEAESYREGQLGEAGERMDEFRPPSMV